MILFGSGHRPQKLGGYSQEAQDRIYKLAYDELRRLKPSVVISGMALGWDTALAMAALDLNLELHAYVPFSGQERVWPQASRACYHQILNRARVVNIVCEGDYAAWKLQRRNEAMVDAGDLGLVLYDGTPGGTQNCVFYAIAKHKPIRNLWKEFMESARLQAAQRPLPL